MSDLDKRVGALSLAQRALLQKRLKLKDPDALEQLDRAAPTLVPAEDASAGGQANDASAGQPVALADRPPRELSFSLLFFSGDGAAASADKYELLLACARHADRYGFSGIWTPERHFHPFGGLYPNPSVIGAALAMVTEQTQIRAGSVVLPLHDPIRVAEEWAVVDNLSRGRVALSFASGWSMDDFVFAPAAYAERKAILVDSIQTIRQLWAGQTIARQTTGDKEVAVQLFPRPLQPELPIWLSSAGSSETFIKAGEIGAHVLTSLIGQTVEQLGEKIALYRAALASHGHDPQRYQVALMLHTFVGSDLATVKEQVRRPMYDYLRTNLGLHSNLAKRRNVDLDLERFSQDDEEVLLEHAFERYFNGSSLLGTPESCLRMIERLRAADIDEVACLVDFGVESAAVVAGLAHIDVLRRLANPQPVPLAD